MGRMGRMRVVTTVLEVAGLASVTTGAALINPAVGCITGGLLTVGVGIAIHLAEPRERQRGGGHR